MAEIKDELNKLDEYKPDESSKESINKSVEFYKKMIDLFNPPKQKLKLKVRKF